VDCSMVESVEQSTYKAKRPEDTLMATWCQPPSDSTATGNLGTTGQVLKNILIYFVSWQGGLNKSHVTVPENRESWENPRKVEAIKFPGKTFRYTTLPVCVMIDDFFFCLCKLNINRKPYENTVRTLWYCYVTLWWMRSTHR